MVSGMGVKILLSWVWKQEDESARPAHLKKNTVNKIVSSEYIYKMMFKKFQMLNSILPAI
jgi:hypothetical protein